jgi:hypothetical protein
VSGTAEPTPAEQHLGDRLAALIDGELGHECRERVLAHLATCHSCKAEADAQRRVKNVFADAAPPGPSDGLLARLQGLSADGVDIGGEDDRGGPSGPAGAGWDVSYLQPGSVLTPRRGFRIHESDRSAASRRTSRRFAFAAAGAFSLAAVAIGSALSSSAPAGSTASPGGGPAASPLRTAATGVERNADRRDEEVVTVRGDYPALLSSRDEYEPLLGSFSNSVLPLPLIRSAYPIGYERAVTPKPAPMAATPNR